ncbi:hypothetical protein DYB32_000139 [Aphanomyces invadans]|uniref:Uncharacterized protein n=1 Tax=Aphanomyces invadans TaxID=157072 RepID=A0A3R6VIN0_9STRA|nr:hypothetical protein DYB32_000139 [Aphanomyces invadans]
MPLPAATADMSTSPAARATSFLETSGSMKLVQNTADDQLPPTPKVDTHTVVPFVSAVLPWLYIVHHINAKQLDRVLAILAKSDGRDKACKIIQYMCKLAMAVNQHKYKPAVGTLARQLSGTRRVLRLGRCLKFFPNFVDAGSEPVGWRRTVATLSAVVGGAGDVGDDVCWISDMNLLSASVATSLEIWIDRLWFATVACDVPLNTADLLDARRAFLEAVQRLDQTKESAVALHNCRAKYLSVWLSQVKLLADFLHSTRRAFDWPTASPLQDAVCGLVSASCAMTKLWQPAVLRKQDMAR